jgi:ABC-type transport system involved in multi-copper enzyme maturation permease subunit
MRSFFLQLGWELRRLVSRPQTWLAFALSLVFELGTATVLKIPSVRADIARDVWKLRAEWGQVFSGATVAVRIMSESFTLMGSFGIALVAGGIVAAEVEQGALRMIFCRPANRASVLLQKWIACVLYMVLLVGFIASSSLAIGLTFEGPGNLVLVAHQEGIMGGFTFAEGMRRYALAVPLMCLSGVSGILWPFFFSCTGMKPAAATILALTVFVADDLVRTTPEMSAVSPYCMTTRMVSWRQVFNDEIPWPRIQRNYTQLAGMDAALAVATWAAFRRRDFRP